MKKISILWAEKVICGDKTYIEVPSQLKDEVKQYLVENGHSELVTD